MSSPGREQAAPPRHRWAPVAVSYLTFILIGVSTGVTGVLLPAQMRDYGVAEATIGITFFTFSAGFLLAGATAGALIHRLDIRASLAIGGGAFVLAGLLTALRPPFAALLAVQVAAGYGTGVLEAVLNVLLARRPNATTLLNRLHAFFGVGALIAPPLATWMLGFAAWPFVWLVLAVTAIPLVVAFWLTLPARVPGGETPAPAEGGGPRPGEKGGGSLLAAVVREPAVLFGAVFLAVYVGVELSVGNWAFTFLTREREIPALLAGSIVSGYWLGLTAGRFVISPIATRLGLTAIGMSFACMFGVTAAALLTWLVPGTVAAVAGLVLFGFFLGPLFPTTMAVAPRLAPPALAPTTIGLLNGVSVIGGALFPWLAGALTEGIGTWTLPPYALALAVLQLLVWRLVTVRMAPEPLPSAAS